jgi:hypothetical protein
MTLTTVIVKWTGPLSYEEVCHSEDKNGLYLLVGKQKYEREDDVQYCGITEGFFCDRINSKHHKLDLIRRDTLSIWLGTVAFPRRFDRRHLEIAEHCLISFWSMAMNERKMYYPRRPVCFISQWQSPAGRVRLKRPAVLREFPDVMWWDLERWRSGTLRVWRPGE